MNMGSQKSRVCDVLKPHMFLSEKTLSKPYPGKGKDANGKLSSEAAKYSELEKLFTVLLDHYTGRVLYREADVEVVLVQDSLLRWHGDFSLIPGMVLDLTFDPGMDILQLCFTPPDECDVEEEMRDKIPKGPQRYSAERAEYGPEYVEMMK